MNRKWRLVFEVFKDKTKTTTTTKQKQTDKTTKA